MMVNKQVLDTIIDRFIEKYQMASNDEDRNETDKAVLKMIMRANGVQPLQKIEYLHKYHTQKIKGEKTQ